MTFYRSRENQSNLGVESKIIKVYTETLFGFRRTK
jgi:hypothetical protein